MKVIDLVEQLKLEVIAGRRGLDKEIEGGFTGDLLSLVIAHAKEKDVWLTVQGHENAVAVAVMVGISAIILTEGVNPNETMCQRADENAVPVLITTQGSYEMCFCIQKLLEQ